MPEKLATLFKSTMGNASSRTKSTRENVRQRRVRGSRRKPQEVEMAEVSPEVSECDEDEDLLILRELISTNPEMFILNNLVMSVQFFRNYDEDIEEIKEKLVSSREAELNSVLLPHKRVLLPDVLQEHVARNVKFTSMRQTLVPTAEPLRPIRIYVVHENVEITEQRNPPEYSTMNDAGVTYQLGLRPSDHEGYVYLERLDVSSPKKKVTLGESDLSSVAEGNSESYSDGESIYGSRASVTAEKARLPNKSHPNFNAYEKLPDHNAETPQDNNYECPSPSNLTSGTEQPSTSPTEKSSSSSEPVKLNNESSSSSCSSGYATYCVASDSDASVGSQVKTTTNTPKTSDDSTCEIPESCFKKIIYTYSGRIYDPVREGHNQNLNTKQRRIKDEQLRYNYTVTYANSSEFSRYFHDVFNEGLGDVMKFDDTTVATAIRHGSVVHCDKVFYSPSRYTVIEPYEVIPSFWSPWPERALEWMERSRSHWPSYEVINKIKEFGCYVIPEGFRSRDGSNQKRKIEWSLNFPAADRYLETCMTSTQIQVYIIALMLHKTFIRPVDSAAGLDTSHIRHKFFWMIEQNYLSGEWPEYRAGECLMELLEALYRNIRQSEPMIRDYYVYNRNLLRNVRKDHLLHSQKQMKRIVENPIMYIFHAMENIRYVREFFPRLDYKELVRILRADTLELINPLLDRFVNDTQNRAPPSEEAKIYDKVSKTGSFWSDAKQKSEHYSIYAKKQFTSPTLINPVKAHDSIIEITERCEELTPVRLGALLNFFVRHFIKMAERCHEFGSLRQRKMYLDHSKRLVILLSEQPGHEDNARHLSEQIRSIEIRTSVYARSMGKSGAPQPPKRNIDPPIFTQSLKDRFIEYPSSHERSGSSDPPMFTQSLKDRFINYATNHHDSNMSDTYKQFPLRGRRFSIQSESAQSFVVETAVHAKSIYEDKGAIYTMEESVNVHEGGKRTVHVREELICCDSEMTHI